MKKGICLIAALILTASIPGAAYAGTVPEPAAVEYSVPEKTDTSVLKLQKWNGSTRLKPDTCYYAEGSVTLKGSVTLPESSMLVIRNGAALKIGSGGKLFVRGAVAVHSGGRINIASKGAITLKSGAVMVNNGTLAVSGGGKLLDYGYLQSQGKINLKGTLKALNNGVLACESIAKKSSSAVLSGENSGIGDRPLYMVQELEEYENDKLSLFDEHTGETTELSGRKSVKKLLQSFEGVLYMYAGEMGLNPGEMVCDSIIDYQYQQIVESGGKMICGISEWGGIPVIEKADWDTEELSGCFYQAVLGKPDSAYFA